MYKIYLRGFTAPRTGIIDPFATAVAHPAFASATKPCGRAAGPSVAYRSAVALLLRRPALYELAGEDGLLRHLIAVEDTKQRGNQMRAQGLELVIDTR